MEQNVALIPNLPTPEGSALGAEMARLLAPEIARYRAQYPDAPDLCGSCAFRLGTHPNGCATSLMDALKCLMEHRPFLCHETVDESGDPTAPCIGWVAGRTASPGRKKSQMPWEFSDEVEG
jgi:hypothetical protein